MTLKLTPHAAETAPRAVGGYAQALEVTGATRFLFVSGQIPLRLDGVLPRDFAGQARQVWAHVRAQLQAAGMDIANIVRVTTYLSDRMHARENREIREDVLGSHTPALTVIIADIFDPAWLLEIEVVAAA
jgi:enamine deaminase RidA (YjgF/YER057c/UK114 family)